MYCENVSDLLKNNMFNFLKNYKSDSIDLLKDINEIIKCKDAITVSYSVPFILVLLLVYSIAIIFYSIFILPLYIIGLLFKTIRYVLCFIFMRAKK